MRGLAACACGLFLVGCASTEPERLPPAIEPEVLIARAAPPAEEIDHLSSAAACVQRGDELAAVPHLQAHLVDRPDAIMIRAYLAELLLRTGKPIDARREFEHFTRQACGMSGEAGKHLVHAHTRLMEIATDVEDPFAEHLHRGIALLLLERQWASEPPADGGQLAESTLVNAARELRLAERRRPTDPRPNVYLAEVFDRLGQPTAARTAARRVKGPDGVLTHSEWATARRLAE